MVSNVKNKACALALFSILWLPFSAVWADCKPGLTIAFSNWPPYHYADSAGNPIGVDVEILRHVLDIKGCKYQFRYIPWKRAVIEVQHGTVDIGLAASKTVERQEYAWFSTPYRRETMVMFMRKGAKWKYSPRSLNELAATDYNVGLVLGVWYGEDLNDIFERHPLFRRRVLQNLEHKSVIDLLVRGRVDVVVSDLFNGVHAAKEDGVLDKITVRPEIINDNDNHFMFSKKSVQEAEVLELDKAINAYLRTPEYRALLLKYLPEEYLSIIYKN